MSEITSILYYVGKIPPPLCLLLFLFSTSSLYEKGLNWWYKYLTEVSTPALFEKICRDGHSTRCLISAIYSILQSPSLMTSEKHIYMCQWEFYLGSPLPPQTRQLIWRWHQSHPPVFLIKIISIKYWCSGIIPCLPCYTLFSQMSRMFVGVGKEGLPYSTFF